MQKAVRWAIGSSLQPAKPSLTTFLLPFDVKSGSAHQQWLGHPAVSKIACIPKKASRLQMPDAWQTRVPFSRHAKDDMLLCTVGNSQGFSTNVNPALLEQGLQQFMRRARMTFAYTLPSLSNQLQMSTLPFFAPRGCTDDIPDSEERSREHSNTPGQGAPLPDSCLEPKPLKWQADQIIYTDGSIRDTREPGYYRSGTGVYRPASDVGPSVQLCIDPIGRQYGVGNTIQRAECVGIHQALSVPHCHHERVIATDSLCAIYMLSKHLRCPSLHRESTHLGILEAAVQAMAESLREGQDIRIIKVKSHIGIKGNEEAGRLAHDASVRMN